MTAIKEDILKAVSNSLPSNVKSFAKRVYFRNRVRVHPALKKFGTVQDLYYWVADGNLDTLLLMQNYFSVFYPGLNTNTEGSLSIYSKNGKTIGTKPFDLAHCGGAKFRVSSLLEELEIEPVDTFGTLEVHIAIPEEVLDHIQGQRALYFWDRFYLGYTNGHGQTCFVHGVDKTHIYREGKSTPSYWYKSPRELQWAPEIPLDIDNYKKFSVILINRTSRSADVALTVSDSADKSLSWKANIPSHGVHRFELTEEGFTGLASKELRMRVKGMPTQFGRPIVFKEFANGAFSAMHC